MYFVTSKAELLTRIEAPSAREAFLKYRTFLQTWHNNTIGPKNVQVVDGIAVAPFDERQLEIRVVNEQNDQDVFAIGPNVDYAVELRDVLSDFLKDADNPANDMPSEIAEKAKQLGEALLKHQWRTNCQEADDEANA